MRKFVWSITLALVTAVFGWWLRSAKVDWSWQPEWPAAVRASGEAVERYVASGHGKPSEADRARAAERARWKAYYFAQLRAAEQLGGLELAAGTTLRELALTDQELRATYEGTVRAAREVAGEAKTEILKDGVRAKVVVEVPGERLTSLRGALLALAKAGRFTFHREPANGPLFALTAPAFAASEGGGKKATGRKSGAGAARPSAAAHPAPAVAPAQAERAASAAATGVVLELASGAALLGATPEVYDAAGTRLGTSFDLPEERLAAGVPVATAGDEGAVRSWAGERPRRYAARVVRRDLFLAERLDAGQVAFFRESLRAGRIVLVLGGAS